MKRTLLILLLLLTAGFSAKAVDIEIKDACFSVRSIQGNMQSVTATVIVDGAYSVPDIWYDYYGTGYVLATQISATLVGGNWVIELSLGSFPAPFLTPLCLYTKPAGSPAPVLTDYFFCAYRCETDLKFACAYQHTQEPGGPDGPYYPAHNYIKVVYGPYLAGFDVDIWVWNGTTFVGPYSPIDKEFVNGFWVYIYDLGVVNINDPDCWDVYPTNVGGTPNQNGQHFLACRCGCKSKFSYCLNTTDPYNYTLVFENQDPSLTMNVTETIGTTTTTIYSGPAIPEKKVPINTGGNRRICIKLIWPGHESCQEECLDICIPAPPEK